MSETNYQTDNGYYMAHKAVDKIAELQTEISRLKAELEVVRFDNNSLRDQISAEARAENERLRLCLQDVANCKRGLKFAKDIASMALEVSV